MTRGGTYRTIINAAVFIILETAALAMLTHHNDLQRIWLSRASHRFMAWAWGGSESIRHYFSLNKTNEELAENNFRLQERVNALEAAVRAYTADSLSSTIPNNGNYIYTPATIVKISRNKAHNYFIIDKGSEDGIHPQTGVITADGAVGVIDAVDKHYSYGLSFINSNSSVSSRIGREGPVGRLSWSGNSARKAVLKDIPLQNRFEQGDTVWTSGFSEIFPPDIPLGTVEDSRIVGGAVYEVSVNLLQDFSSVRYVTVVYNSARDEIKFLENLEEEAAR